MQNASEKQTAEQVRMCLRRGVHRMLDNMQQQRELEPSNVAAMVAELNRLKEVHRILFSCPGFPLPLLSFCGS